jgi:aryl-alcohol dehydrogenase-like predicted oxidoreductase
LKYRKFGKLDWELSEIGFGAWAIGGDMWGPQNDDDSVSALHKALDLGVNFIDTAQGYGSGHSEEIIGNVLKERKENIFIATKVPPKGYAHWPPPENYDSRNSFPAEYIIEECEKSLKRLQRDYVDIYQFHTWASAFNIRDEWFEAMSKLKQQGKIRAIGVSVHDTTPDSVLASLVNGRVDSVQVIYNIFEQFPEFNLLPIAEKTGTGIIVRVPFDEGSLTGKFTAQTTFPEGDVRKHYFRGNNLPAVIKKVKEIEDFKNKKGHTSWSMPDYALRFCLSHSAVSTVIPGIRNVKQAEMNTAVSDGIRLDANELEELKQFYWRKDFWHEEVVIEENKSPNS